MNKILLLATSVALMLLTENAFGQACELVVDQPQAPTIVRIDGNSIGGTVYLRVASHPAYGSWTLRLAANMEFRPPGGSSFGLVSSTSQDSSVPAGTAVGVSYAVTVPSVLLETRGDGDYRVTLTAVGNCNGSWYSLTPNNPSSSINFNILRPRLTTNGIAGMWWLNGISDPAAQLYDQAQIVGTRNCATCQSSMAYSILAGSDKASLTCVFCDTTNAKSKAPSASCNAQDVIVTASLNGFSAASPIRLSVNTFLNAKRTTEKPPFSTTSALNGGWRTAIFYQVSDLCTAPVYYSVSVNETFGTRTPASSQWILPAMRPGFVIPFADEIAVAPPQPGSLQPVPPQGLTGPLVDQIPWFARIGSQSGGVGLLVMSTDQLRYLDHGDHSSNP